MRDYGKVYSTFWSSQTTGSLSDDGKLLAMYLMTCTHSTIAGVFRLPDGYVSEDLSWSSERVAKGFDELLRKGFANRCGTTKWVWIVKHLDWNKPENPNQRKSAAKIASGIPDECGWKQAFMRVCGPSLGLQASEKANPCATVAEPFRNQEQEQEQEQEQPSALSAKPTAKPPTISCPYAEIVAMYHEVLPSMPHCRLMPADRQRAMRRMWGWVLSSTKTDGTRRAKTTEEALQWLRGYFLRASENDFLMGRTQRRPEHSNWRCDLDFLLTDKGMKQVIEKTQEAA